MFRLLARSLVRSFARQSRLAASLAPNSYSAYHTHQGQLESRAVRTKIGIQNDVDYVYDSVVVLHVQCTRAMHKMASIIGFLDARRGSLVFRVSVHVHIVYLLPW